MSNSAPTTSCRPIYHQEYFIFDREDLQTLTAESPVIKSVRNREGNEIELSASESRTVTDIIVWSCVVVILSLLLLSLAFCCHCCLCYVNRRRSAKRKRVRMPFLLVFGCGVLTAAVVLSSFVNGSILLWLEIDLNTNLTSQADSAQNYINMTTQLTNRDNDTVKQITLDPLFHLQDIRFWITMGFLGCLLVILTITFLTVCICTPVSRSAAPLVTMLILEAVFTMLASIVASILFGTLLFFSIICYDLYRLGGERWCDETNNIPLERSLGNFCGKDTVSKFYITAGTYGILIILLVAVQLLGGVYTAVVTHGYSERPIRHTRQQEQPRQRTLERARETRNDRDHRRRPSRNTQRSTANPTARTEEAFILRARPSQRERYDPLNSFTPTRFQEPGQDRESQNLNVSSHPVNALNLSAITYPEEALPSYDEVIQRDSETSAIPLIATTPLQTLGGVPEADEPASETDAGVTVTSAVDHEAGNDNQEADATAEEDLAPVL